MYISKDISYKTVHYEKKYPQKSTCIYFKTQELCCESINELQFQSFTTIIKGLFTIVTTMLIYYHCHLTNHWYCLLPHTNQL